MPAKVAADAIALENVRILCCLMAYSSEFTPDFDKVAREIGIAQSRNVPRKIDTIINSAGFTLKNKKIVKLDDANTHPSSPAKKLVKASVPKTPVNSDAEEDAKPARKGKTSKTTRVAPKKQAPKKAAGKKRKAADSDETDEDEAEHEAKKPKARVNEHDEALEMIKATMGGDSSDEVSSSKVEM